MSKSNLGNQKSPLNGDSEGTSALYAAIAMALYEFEGNNVHDHEPGIITIKPKSTLWNAKFLSMTKKP